VERTLAELKQPIGSLEFPDLHAKLQDVSDEEEKLRLRLALLACDEGEVEPLFEKMLEADPPMMLVIRDQLLPFKQKLIPKLWKETRPKCLFPALVALVKYDPDNPRLQGKGAVLAKGLLQTNPVYLGDCTGALQPIRNLLLPQLRESFQRSSNPIERQVAATILADHFRDDPDTLAVLAKEADPAQFKFLYARLYQQEAEFGAAMKKELDEKISPDWHDPALNAPWSGPTAEQMLQFKTALGELRIRYAFCQTMKMEVFLAVSRQLSSSGYRPIRFRPYWNDHDLRVAAVFVRDGREWEVASELTAKELGSKNLELANRGFSPVDVVGVPHVPGSKKEETYFALWTRASDGGIPSRMTVGQLGEPSVKDLAPANGLIGGLSMLSARKGSLHHGPLSGCPANRRHLRSSEYGRAIIVKSFRGTFSSTFN
jgi:hypothetical protein